MRLFIAIDFPPNIKSALAALQTKIPGAVWVKPPALHLTLRFLGDHIDPIRLIPITMALKNVNSAPFTVELSGVGRFPPAARRPARVLWVGIAEQPALLHLQAQVEQALVPVGFQPEQRPFSPHVTLARLKGEAHAEALAAFLTQHHAFRLQPFAVSEFHLMSSLLTPQGPQYRQEASLTLNQL